MTQELTPKFMNDNGRIKKGMKVSWNEYIAIYERQQKEIEQKKREQSKKEDKK